MDIVGALVNVRCVEVHHVTDHTLFCRNAMPPCMSRPIGAMSSALRQLLRLIDRLIVEQQGFGSFRTGEGGAARTT